MRQRPDASDGRGGGGRGGGDGGGSDASVGTRVQRFTPLERAIHWCVAALVGVCMATAAALSIAPVATLVGRRELVREVHVVCGLLLVAPLLLLVVLASARPPGPTGPTGPLAHVSADVRADVRRLARFDHDDLRWLRTRARADARVRARAHARPRTGHGKFHPGQKLNAAASAAALVSLYATGVVLRWFEPFPLWLRQGATFVHDWTAFLFVILVAAHVARALADPMSLRGMVTGDVDRAWARHRHPRWLTPPSAASLDPIPGAPSPSGARTGPSSR
jgi:formate dehydrogenase subunit gamma